MFKKRRYGMWEMNSGQKVAIGLMVLVGVTLMIMFSGRLSGLPSKQPDPPSQAKTTTPAPAPPQAKTDTPILSPTTLNTSADNQTINRKEVIAEARAFLREIKAMESEGRSIPQRIGAGHEDCMNKINGRWQRVQALRERIKRLPKTLQTYIGTAAAELINCYSCDSDSLSLCGQARDWIKEAEKDIAEYARGEN
jgi:hypothetical protein